ncbi:MAG: hypothetical protein L0J57_00605 [Brachybacterium sp.]|uniref:hypothetical protein n=3 Tax=Brachybacterium alimentarium TaxID=47845 RepID=UPI000DF16D41|nr:hypothetical protein [Brachybacterium alimentarium]MDN6301538.1 hypothetical protein [Brachybacterium sp.]RCS68771.1 hypothetical protein CIK68_12550 [Brachybacterium alimentarium]
MAPDVEDELFGDSARVARSMSTVVMRAVEQMQRRREERARREGEGYRESAQALAERETAQKEAMRALIAPARDPQWIERASDRDVAIAYVYAEAYAGQDEHARHTRDSLGRHLESRHGDVAAFVDSHVTAEEIEQVPVPRDADLSPSQARLVAARDETAEKWANVFEVSGEERASQWLESNLDQSEKARLETHHLQRRAALERSEADAERGRASEPAVDRLQPVKEWAAKNQPELYSKALLHEANGESEPWSWAEHTHDQALGQLGGMSVDEARSAVENADLANASHDGHRFRGWIGYDLELDNMIIDKYPEAISAWQKDDVHDRTDLAAEGTVPAPRPREVDARSGEVGIGSEEQATTRFAEEASRREALAHSRATEHEDAAAGLEKGANRERAGRGIHPHDPAQAQKGNVTDAEQREALEAAQVAQGGREEPVREQLAAQRSGRAQGRHRRAKQNQDRERTNERGR